MTLSVKTETLADGIAYEYFMEHVSKVIENATEDGSDPWECVQLLAKLSFSIAETFDKARNEYHGN